MRHRTSFVRGFLHTLRCFAQVALAVTWLTSSLALAQDAAPTLLAGGQVRLSITGGWQAQDVGLEGAVVRPTSGQGWPVELAVWTAPAGADISVDSAAAAQETALFRLAPYARKSATAFTSSAGVPGLLVVGQMRTREGKDREAVFAAFANGRRFAVVGTFCDLRQSGGVWSGDFGAMARSFEWAAPAPIQPSGAQTTPAATPGTGKPPLPVPPLEGKPGGATTPPLEPTTPAVAGPGQISPPKTTPPEDPPATRPRVEPATVIPITAANLPDLNWPLPVGWTARLNEGFIEASPAGGGETRPNLGLAVCPLLSVAEGQDPVALAQLALAKWPALGGKGAGLRFRLDGKTAWFAGLLGEAGETRRVVGCCTIQGDSALLSLFYVAPAQFAAQVPQLCRSLAQFSGGPWWSQKPAAPALRELTDWTEPFYGAWRLPVPAGWEVQGGLTDTDGLWSFALRATSNDERRLSVTWQQPLQPFFRELSPVLTNLGWQEGDRFGDANGAQLRILNRMGPAEFLTRYWLPKNAPTWEQQLLSGVVSKPPVAALTLGLNAIGSLITVEGKTPTGPRERSVLLATAEAPARLGTGCWQVATLECEAPQGALAEAQAVLRTMVLGAELLPGSKAPAGQVSLLLRGAQQAATVLPAPEDKPAQPYPALAQMAATGQGPVWMLSPQTLAGWRAVGVALQEGKQPAEALPELSE